MGFNIKKKDYLRVKVIPSSPKNEIVEILNDENGEETIKIRIKAVPEKGKANKELIKFLSEELKLPKTAICIIGGKSDRIKLIKINGTD